MPQAKRAMPVPSFDELRERAERLVPVLRERAAKTEALRRIPDETIADLHQSKLFRMLQPARGGGSELPYGAFVELAGIIGRGCRSTRRVLHNLARHPRLLVYLPNEAPGQIWDASP